MDGRNQGRKRCSLNEAVSEKRVEKDKSEMTRVFRVSGFHEGTINASIDDVWALATDWGSLAWFNDEDNDEGMKLMQT